MAVSTGTPGLMMPAFSAAIFGQRVAQPLSVIELDVGDDAGQRGDDVGGVQPPAQAGFPDHQIALLLGEIAQAP